MPWDSGFLRSLRVLGDEGSGHRLVRKEGVVAALKHQTRKVLHQGLGLDVEVAEHLIRSPAAEKADGVCVHVGTEESHCSRGAE